MFKKERGITLVALVVTIIILLILAGVSIAMASGNGLFNRFRNAMNAYKNSVENEAVVLNEYEKYMKNEIGE